MQNIVVVPGIFGTQMVRAGDDFILWPPLGDAEILDPQTRATQLIDVSTRPGGLVEGIRIGPFVDLPEYSPLTSAIAALPATTLIRFPYDWRIDIRLAAATLAQTLSDLDTNPVVLVAHSMGGLVCRYMLKCGVYAQTPWFARIRQLICIATPHLGAPLSVFRLLGREGMNAVLFGGDCMAILASQPQTFPAGHQLLPPADIGFVHLPGGQRSAAGPAFPQLAQAGIDACAALHDTLDRFQRPPGVQYRFASATATTAATISATPPARSTWAPAAASITSSATATAPSHFGAPCPTAPPAL